LKLVGRVPRAHLESGDLVRLRYPPFDVLVSLVEGAPCAIEDACNHAGASLAVGDRDESGRCVVCPVHAYVFDLASGECVAPKGLCDDQRRFVARFDGDDVVVYDPVELVILR
jgi:nitrite reductase/ring-hydroxylating ferredoxin subunit